MDIQNRKRACSQNEPPFDRFCSERFTDFIDLFERFSLDGNRLPTLSIQQRKKAYQAEKKLLLDLPNGGFFPLLQDNQYGPTEKIFPELSAFANEARDRVRRENLERAKRYLRECDEGPNQGAVLGDAPIVRKESAA
jgi:hypothetical protein